MGGRRLRAARPAIHPLTVSSVDALAQAATLAGLSICCAEVGAPILPRSVP